MKRRILALILLIAAVLFLVTVTSPKSAEDFTARDASDTAVKDANAALNSQYGLKERIVSVLSTSYDGEKWHVALEAVIGPHSPCPEVQRITYEMFPIVSRNETLVRSSECYSRPITRRAEAQMDSYANSAKVRDKAAQGYLACSFSYPLTNLTAEREYCYFLDEAGLASFASKRGILPGAWVVQWSVPGRESFFVALDGDGRVITES